MSKTVSALLGISVREEASAAYASMNPMHTDRIVQLGVDAEQTIQLPPRLVRAFAGTVLSALRWPGRRLVVFCLRDSLVLVADFISSTFPQGIQDEVYRRLLETAERQAVDHSGRLGLSMALMQWIDTGVGESVMVAETRLAGMQCIVVS